MRRFLFIFLLLSATTVFAQKPHLNHTVYDGWQSIGKKSISANGQWIIYNINVQEADDDFVVQLADGSRKIKIERGYNGEITNDSRFAICMIKPHYKDIREAKIKKKKADDQPKDSLAMINLQTLEVTKIPQVKSYKLPEEGAGYLLYQLHPVRDTAKAKNGKVADSLQRVIDSLQKIIESQSVKKGRKKRNNDDIFFAPDPDENAKQSGAAMTIRNLLTGDEKVFQNVKTYMTNKRGGSVLLEVARDADDSASLSSVLLYDIRAERTDTLSRGGNDFKGFALSEDGSKAAFVAERDAKPKELQKFYKLWFFEKGMDSARMLVDKSTTGVPQNFTVSENGRVYFSKSGERLLFGTAPIQPPKDTTLEEIDAVKLDIWHYKDDYLQTVQLSRLNQEKSRSYLAVYQLNNNKLVQIESDSIPIVYTTGNGDGEVFVGATDIGRRTESQWRGNTIKDVYAINTNTGMKTLVKKDLHGVIMPSYISPEGKYIVWYDYDKKNYFASNGRHAVNITAGIKVPLYSEDHDQPSEPGPYGIMGWLDGDNSLLIYDRYDIWKADPAGKAAPQNVTKGAGRESLKTYRYLKTDTEEDFIDSYKMNLLSVFDNNTKTAGIAIYSRGTVYTDLPSNFTDAPYYIGTPEKAKDAMVYIYTKENYEESPNLYVFEQNSGEKKLTNLNPQQNDYNWGTAELYTWKAFNGKRATGILYKPEDFDSTKKYPVIMYFYEKLSDGLYRYQPPAPTPSRLNIPFFVSRGYVVFAPDIEYQIGHPAKSAYDYVVSAAEDLAKQPWIDEKNMGIQGQSWGGIQVAQLITMTDMFKAAWAGAPVSNMTSAYGGIRWTTGLNRQFQYEKTQSRIGATLWEKPELYIENSPLFHVPDINTPLVIMHNDEDGSVPWYQGIELFTAMVRLGKPVWLLNYNGEAHNIVERKNRKDIQIREQQFFDWLLKGEKPAKWLVEGVKAVDKGRNMGLEIVE